jgi:hypothetical protein
MAMPEVNMQRGVTAKRLKGRGGQGGQLAGRHGHDPHNFPSDPERVDANGRTRNGVSRHIFAHNEAVISPRSTVKAWVVRFI